MSHNPTPTPVPKPTAREAKMIAAHNFLLSLSFMTEATCNWTSSQGCGTLSAATPKPVWAHRLSDRNNVLIEWKRFTTEPVSWDINPPSGKAKTNLTEAAISAGRVGGRGTLPESKDWSENCSFLPRSSRKTRACFRNARRCLAGGRAEKG